MKFGIIGTNFVSIGFMEGIKATPTCEVIAVCSGRKANAIRFAEEYHIPLTFDTYQDMLEAKVIDAVYIATPNSMHFEQAKYFLERKIPVFCEKPMASNVNQVKQLFEIAKANNTYLHDGIMPLYSPNFQLLKKEIASLGGIRRVVLSFQKYSSRYDAYLRNENPTTFRKELSNGAFMDLGVYTISDAVALFGKPNEIFASATLLDTGVDCMNTALFKYDTFDVVVMNSKVTNTKIISEVQGKLGLIQFDAPSQFFSMTKEVYGQALETLEVDMSSPFKHQLEVFYDVVSNGNIESTFVPHQLSIDIHEVLTECRRQCGIVYPDDAS